MGARFGSALAPFLFDKEGLVREVGSAWCTPSLPFPLLSDWRVGAELSSALTVGDLDSAASFTPELLLLLPRAWRGGERDLWPTSQRKKTLWFCSRS